MVMISVPSSTVPEKRLPSPSFVVMRIFASKRGGGNGGGGRGGSVNIVRYLFCPCVMIFFLFNSFIFSSAPYLKCVLGG